MHIFARIWWSFFCLWEIVGVPDKAQKRGRKKVFMVRCTCGIDIYGIFSTSFSLHHAPTFFSVLQNPVNSIELQNKSEFNSV